MISDKRTGAALRAHRPARSFRTRACASLRAHIAVLLLALAASTLIACADRDGVQGDGSGYGGITARAVWKTGQTSKQLQSPHYSAALPPGVVTVRATVSGSDFEPMTQETPVAERGDAISGVPVGVNRTLTLHGLDGGGSITYEGIVTGITVIGGDTTDAGTVAMAPTFAGFSFTPSTQTLSLTEGGSSKTIKVRPYVAPAAGMIIVLDVSPWDSTEVDVDPDTLSWDATNFSTQRTITVTPVADGESDGNQPIALSFDTGNSTDADYQALVLTGFAITVADTTPAFTIAPATLTTAEGGPTQGFTIRPNTNPGNQVITVEITSTDETEGTVDQTTLSWDSGDWETEKAVVVTPENDGEADGNQTYDIELNPATSTHAGYAALGVQTVEVTNSDNDAPGFTISSATLATSESGSAKTFTIRPNTDPVGDTVEVTISVTDSTEGSASPGTLSWDTSDWQISKTVTVTPEDDDEDDGNQTYDVELDPANSSAAGYDVLGVQTVEVTNSDDDTAAFTISTTTLSTSEGGGVETFTIRPNTNPGASTVEVDVTSMDTTEGTVSPATLTWTSADWETAKTVTVTPVNDSLIDGNPTYDIEIDPGDSTEANYAALGVQAVEVTNSDNDTAGFTITPTTLSTSEAGTAKTFTIRPNTDPGGEDIVVDITSENTSEGTVSPGMLSWDTSDWQTAKTVTVTPVDEAIDDGNQTYDVNLDPQNSTATGYDALAVQTVEVTNSDNDTAGFTITPTTLSTSEGGPVRTFTIRPNTDPGANNVEVDIGSTDTTEGTVSPAALSWTTADYTTAKTVTVTPVNDFVVDGSQDYDIELDPDASSDPAYGGGALPIQIVNVSNADTNAVGVTVTPVSGLLTTEDADTDTFTVVLNTVPNGDVVIDVTSLDGTEVYVHGPGGSPTISDTLAFTNLDWSTPQTVTVTGQADGTGDGNQTVTVQLAMDTGATTDSTGYDGVNPADVQITNLDNQSPGITVTPISGLATSELGLTDTFSVVLNKLPTGNVVIDVTSLDTTEITVDKATLTFTTANWSTPQVVTVTGQDDVTIDGNVVAAVELVVDTGATADAGYHVVEPGDVTVTNSDDDAAGVTVNPASGLATTEDGGTASFTVVLNTPPDDDVVIDIAVSDATEISVNKSELTFTTSDWSTPQSVTISGVVDSTQDGSQTVSVLLTIDGVNTLDNTGYMAINPPDATVINVDNDAAGITVMPGTTLFTTEGGGSATFTVLLNTMPGGTVEIDVTPADATELSVNKSTLTFTASDWATPQIVTVTGVDDVTADGNQTTTIALAVDDAASSDAIYEALANINVTVVNADDDVPGVTVLPTTGLTTSEGGATATFSVVLNRAPSASSNVVILLFNETADEIDVDKASLIFTTSDWATPQYVTLTGLSDGAADGTQPTGVSLTMNTLLTTDTSGYGSVNPADVSGINLDNNVGITVNPASGLVTSEGGATTTFSVVLNTQPNGDVVIDIASEDTGEVTSDKSELTFNEDDWATPQIVTLTGVDDGATADGSQTIFIFLDLDGVETTDSTGYALLDPPDAEVTNIDDDSGGFTVTPIAGLVTTESGASDTFSVRLNLPPASGMEVVLDVISGDTGEVSVSASSLTFTDSDWATPQTVTVTGVNDTSADGDILVTVAVDVDPALTTDDSWDGLDPDDVDVTNEDNESQGEGSVGSPVSLPIGSLPAEGTVGATSSYYVVSGLTPSASYMVTTTSVSADIELYIYDDNGFTNEICPETPDPVTFPNENNVFNDERPESCVVTAPVGGTLYVRVAVDGVFSPGGGTYLIDVFPAPTTTEGADGAPLDITSDLPFLGRGYNLGNTLATSNFYVVSGLTPSTTYRVQITNLTANVDLRVYAESTFDTLLCSAQVSSIAETCEAQSTAGGELYIRAWRNTNPVPALSEVAYYIDVLPQLTDEGSALVPIDLTGNMPYEGMIKTTASYYKVTGLVPNASYQVQLINMAGQGALRVYPDSDFVADPNVSCDGNPPGGPGNWSDRAGNFPELCTVSANGSGQLFFAAHPTTSVIQPFSTAGATYTIQVK